MNYKLKIVTTVSLPQPVDVDGGGLKHHRHVGSKPLCYLHENYLQLSVRQLDDPLTVDFGFLATFHTSVI